jgi:uncharacterized protein YkwD
MWPIFMALSCMLALSLQSCGGGGSISESTPLGSQGGTAGSNVDILSTRNTNSLLNQALALTAGQSPHPLPVTVVRGSDAIDGHFDRLNEVRFAMQLPVLAWNDQLAQAAQCDANYLRTNAQFGHSESPQKPGYCGEGFAERQVQAGYAAFINSELIISSAPQTRADGFNLMDAVLASPGHRVVALAHEFSDIGIGAAPLTTELGSHVNVTYPDYRVLVYPCSGQSGVATGFAPASETPDPLPGVPIAGFPITLHAGLFVKFTVESASLVNARTAGTVELLGPTVVGSTQSAFFFFARQPLDTNTTYLFTADVLANGQLQRVRSIFSTAGY